MNASDRSENKAKICRMTLRNGTLNALLRKIEAEKIENHL